jgi:hypothetical protein
MLKKPIVLDVLAVTNGENQKDIEFLEDTGLIDVYDSATVPIHYCTIDYFHTDERSTLKKPLTIIHSGSESFVAKVSKMELSDRITRAMQ